MNKPISLKGKAMYYNRPLPLAEHFIPLIGDKKAVKIADIGSGPFPITGQYLEGVKVELYHSDRQNFDEFWKKYNSVPLFPIEIQNMEKLTYEDDFFDIVNCVNALDHTLNAEQAVKEMIRVCKGWVYIDCALYQRTDQGHKHYWDATEEGVFISKTDWFDLNDFGFNIKFIDNKGERQYNHIIATKQC